MDFFYYLFIYLFYFIFIFFFFLFIYFFFVKSYYLNQSLEQITVAFSSFSGVSKSGWNLSSTVVKELSKAASFGLNSCGISVMPLDFDILRVF